MSVVVQTVNLNKKYKNKHALKDFNITINKGDIYGLIGVNGAGKSTLIKIIAGITMPTSGSLELFGDECDLDAKRRRIGSVIENPSFAPNLTAKQNLEYYATVMGINDKELVDSLLAKVHLDQKSKQTFRQFSLGMKQRLGIAFAMMNSSEFIILDEPTNGLDPIGILELRDIIYQLNQQGVTFLICSHILSELSQIATKYGIVDNGEFIKELTDEELKMLRQDRLCIKVEAEHIQTLENMLSEYGYIYSSHTGTYEITLNDDINSFLEKMVEKKIRISSIYQIKTSLEDVFLKAIGGAKNA